MPVTYTNRKGRTYTLCQGTTKTGKPRFFFTREPKGDLPEEIPDGYEISESVNGIVSLVKTKPKLIEPRELSAVQKILDRHPKSRNYRLNVKHDRIEVYELDAPDLDRLVDALSEMLPIPPSLKERMLAEQEQYGKFTPIVRFILSDREKRTFQTMRMCFLGSIDDWISIAPTGSIEQVAREVIPRLGTESFFDLY